MKHHAIYSPKVSLQNVSVLYDDHFPVLVTIQINSGVTLNNKSKNLLLQECVDWPKFND